MKQLPAEDRLANSSPGNFVISGASLTLIILCAIFAIHRQTPPEARPADAPADEFASGRAMGHLKVIARKPHPIGSEDHATVREYILRQLTSLGLNPEVQRSLVLNRQRGGPYVSASVQNIIGKMAGANSRQAIMLACHYDSTPTSPGASDDGASVAALLEVIRALKVGAPLKNDVLFLFTDGEEIGMLGAKAFMNEHPYAKDVALALNFEARGVGGPSIMFETSEGNEWLIREFADAVQRPVANSLTFDLYKLLPNSTDFSIFKNGGLRGLNFAYINGLSFYHTARDSYENIDERSLQHQGSLALALVRRAGQVGDWPARTGNAVYFDLFSSTLVSYSGKLVRPLMALGLILFVGLVALGLRMKRLTVRGLAFGAAGWLLNVIGVLVIMILIWLAIQNVSSNPTSNQIRSHLYAIGFLCLTITLTAALFIWLRRKTQIENLMVGALLWWVGLMVLLCLRVPGGSYLVTWPLLLMLPALGAIFISRVELTSAKSLILLTCPALSGVILIVPLINLMIAGFGLDIVWISMALVVLLLTLHYAHLNALMSIRLRPVILISGLLGLGFISAVLLSTETSRKHPKRDYLLYALNADTGKAIWGSIDNRPDEWTSQFFGSSVENISRSEFFPWGKGAFLRSQAPALSLAPPSAAMLDDRRDRELRVIRVKVASPRRAQAMTIYWKQELELQDLAVNGKRVEGVAFDPAGNPAIQRMLLCVGLPEEGIELSLEVKSFGQVELQIEDWSYGLPETLTRLYKERPDYLIASPFPYNDCTIVRKSVSF
jgi:hypothetical protein